MNLDKLGTFENARITGEDVAERVRSFPQVESVVSVNELQDGLNLTAEVVIESNSVPSTVFFKSGSFNNDESFLAEPFVLKKLQDARSVNAPNPVYYDYSSSMPINYPWYLTTFVTGKSGLPTDETEALHLAEEAGQLLAAINNIECEKTGASSIPREGIPDTGSQFTTDQSVFTGQQWQDVFADDTIYTLRTANSRLGDLISDCIEYIEQNYTKIPEVSDPRLLHFDYWWENLLWTDKRPICIDWQRAYSGLPEANLALAEYLLFDKYEWGTDAVISKFRQAYRTRLDRPLRDLDSTVWSLYELYPRAREIRGFPYWWRNATTTQQDKREEAVRSQIDRLLTGRPIRPLK